MEDDSPENSASAWAMSLLVLFVAMAGFAYLVGYQAACRQIADALEEYPAMSDRVTAVTEAR